jgi:DNA-binding transcriptional LysR family regulator
MGPDSTFVTCNDVIHIMHGMHLAGIDLNLAVVLHALLTERSVSRAAKRLGLSQSATSHALGRLRDLLGDPVVVRTRDGVAPTPRADALAEGLSAALGALEDALLGAPAFDPKTAERRFYVSASDYAEFVLLPPLLARTSVDAPGVDVWVRPYDEGLAEHLRRGDVDVVLGVPASIEEAEGIKSAQLFDEGFVCVARKGHPLLRGTPSAARFAAARHAFIAPRGRPGGAVDVALAALGLERRVVFAVPHFLIAPHVVAETDLVLTVAERVARAYAKSLPIQIFAPPVPMPRFTLSMFWHRRHDADPAHTWLRGALAAAAAKLGAPPKRARRR